MTLIRLFVISILVGCAISPIWASTWRSQPYQENRHEDAILAMQQGNFAVAYCIWQPLAEDGDPQAQYNLGWMYHNGYGLRINDERAHQLWLLAAQHGSIDALAALGDLYADGLGVERNQAIALGFYISAAIKNHETARETLLEYLSSDQPLVIQTFKQLLQSDDWPVLGNIVTIGVKRANTRLGPAIDQPIVATLEEGHPVIPLRTENGWTYVGITGLGKTAWVFSELIAKPAGAYPLDSIEQPQ